LLVISRKKEVLQPTPRIVILTGDAAESLEVMHPYQRPIHRNTPALIGGLE